MGYADFEQKTCVENCTDKFLKHSERVGARFAEHNAGMSLPWHRGLFLVVFNHIESTCSPHTGPG